MTKSKFFILLAFVFLLLDTLIAGNIITASGMGWLLPAGLTSFMVAFLVD